MSVAELQSMVATFMEDRPELKRDNSVENVFKYLRAETDEAEAEIDHPEKIGAELADIVLFAMTIANQYGINLEEVSREKVARNILKYDWKKLQGDVPCEQARLQIREDWAESKGEEEFYAD